MKIATYGFAEDQGKKLQRILRLSRTNPYQLVDFDPQHLPDLLLLYGEEQLQTPTINELPSSYHSRLILVGKSRPQNTEYPYISYPLISSRVLAALDQLTSANEDSFEVEDNAPETENQYAKYFTEQSAKAKPEEVTADFRDAAETGQAGRTDGEQPVEQPLSVEDALAVTPAESEQHLPEPDAEPASDAADGVAGDKAVEADVEGGAYKVLVVDDSQPMQKALEKELKSQFSQVNVDFADDGIMALEKVEANAYDFIFLDIMMPGIDGFETCTRMRQIEKLKKLPIIMLSSKTSPLDEVKGIMAGSSTYLTKPIVPEEFQKVMSRITKWVDDFAVKAN